MQIQQVWAIGKKNAAATCIPAIDKNIQTQSPTNRTESLNHVATTLRQLRQIPAITPTYAAMAAPKYAAITQQVIIWLTSPGKFEKTVAVQTCTLIPEQQELQLSVGLVRNISSLFQFALR